MASGQGGCHFKQDNEGRCPLETVEESLDENERAIPMDRSWQGRKQVQISHD